MLGQLSAGIAHEIRNPLAAVNLNLQVLRRKTKKEDPNYEFIETALQGVDRISRIVEVTLNFSRPTLPDVKGMSLNDLLSTVLEMVASMLKRKEIEVNLILNENLPLIQADAKQMQQVFINLITNAADSIKTKGKIEIETYMETAGRKGELKYVAAAITDSGCGIPPDDLRKIFNPFFTRKADGTGLGLPITQRILHQHNGIIDVESNIDKGTTFYVKLPVTIENS